jgi:sortase A
MTLAALLLCAISVWQFASAAYIHAKAELAQWLVEDAWRKIKQGEAGARPWPWADTWPVARLTVARLSVEQMVLAGASGRTLAFGPGWMKASAIPGEPGSSVIAAHRDTHFAFLKHLRPGDVIDIETVDRRVRYSVTHRLVADSDQHRLQPATGGQELVLVTCYPFDALTTGGPLRYLVFAEPLIAPSRSIRTTSEGKKVLF